MSAGHREATSEIARAIQYKNGIGLALYRIHVAKIQIIIIIMIIIIVIIILIIIIIIIIVIIIIIIIIIITNKYNNKIRI
jgi:hypothetical protein